MGGVLIVVVMTLLDMCAVVRLGRLWLCVLTWCRSGRLVGGALEVGDDTVIRMGDVGLCC